MVIYKDVTYHVMDYRDLQALISEQVDPGAEKYDYNIVAAFEWSNDSCYSFNNIIGQLDEWEQVDIDEDIKDKAIGTALCAVWLEYLVKKQLLPPGNYLIEVW